MLFNKERDQRRALSYELLEGRRLMATNIWKSTVASGNWDVDANWSLGHAPLATEDVKIGPQTVTYRKDVSTVKSLTTDGPLVVIGATAWLKVTGAFDSKSTVTLERQGYLDAAQFNATGAVSVNNLGWLKVSGPFDSKSSVTLTGGNLDAAQFSATGVVTVGGDGKLTVTGGLNSSSNVALNSGGFIDAGQFSTTGSVILRQNTRLNLTGATPTLHAGGGIDLGATAATIKNAIIDATTSLRISTLFSNPSYLVNVTTSGSVDMANSTTGVGAVVQGNLTLNNNQLTIGQGSTLAFEGNTASLLGTGSVFFKNERNNSILAGTDGMTLTIGPGMTIRGGNTQQGTSQVGGALGVTTATLRVEGKIIADPGMKIRICDTANDSSPFANTVQVLNAGSLHAQGGTLDIAGKLTGADARRVTQSNGGSINLVGQLDNTGLNWNLSNGAWNLVGGKIIGGTITQSATNRLIFSSIGGTLDGVTIIGNTTMAQGTKVSVVGNLTYNNGTLTLGQGVSLAFSSLTAGLIGNGTVVFDNQTNNEIVATVFGMTLSIGAGITIRGGNSASATSNSMSRIYATVSSVTLQADGRIVVDSGKSIAINRLTNSNTVMPSRLVNTGTLDAGTGKLYVDGQFTTRGLGNIKRSNGEVNIEGALDNTGDNLIFTTNTGSWNLLGGSITGGTISQSVTNHLDFTTSGGVLSNVRLDGDTNMGANTRVAVLGNLTLTGGTTTLNDQSRIFFDGENASLLGNGTVFFSDNATSGLVTRKNGMTLTIGKDVTIRGGHTANSDATFIGNYQGTFLLNGQGQNTNVRIEGKVIADLPGRQLGIRPTNKLINVGIIEAKSGDIALDGFFTREDLGIVKSSEGGVIKINGTLDNQLKSLSFDNVTGSWSLVGGTIVGGSILQSTNRLLFSSFGGKLDGVTISGDADFSAAQTQVNIVNGLTLDGRATLGARSTITFLGDQTLGGRANIFFQNQSGNALNLKGANMTLTVGPDVVISGGGGGNGSDPSAIFDISAGTTSPTVVLNGTILASNPITSGAIRVNLPSGRLVANGRLESQGGDVRITQSMTLPAVGTFVSSSNGSATFGGNLSFDGRDPSKIQLLGTNNFTGSSSLASPQLLEGLSQDLGPIALGFSTSNYLLGTLVVKNNTKLRLIDLVDNAPDTKREAVYVNSLVIEANANLNVGLLNLYYRSITILGTGNSKGTITTDLGGGTHQLVTGGGALPFNSPTPGTIDSTQKQHDWTFQGTQGGWVSLDASPGAGLWLRMRLLDASNNTLRTVISSAAGAVVTISNFILPGSGIFHVLIDADPLHSTSVGIYVVTLTDSTPNRRAVNIAITSNRVQGIEYGNAIEFTAMVTAQAPTAPTLTGTVQFKVDGVVIGGPVVLISGVAKLRLTLPNAGARSVTVDFTSDNGNFDASSSNFVQQITKKVLTFRATDILQRVAGTAFTLNYTVFGFVPGEDAQVLTNAPVLSVDPSATNTVGSYVINIAAGNLSASNYSFQFITGTMIVLPSLPFKIDIRSGGDQKVIINRALPLLHRLKVVDEFRNPIPGATVVFEAPSSGSSGTFAGGQASVSVKTSNLGEAQAPAFTVNDVPGSFFITATCNGIVAQFQVTIAAAGAPLEFVPLSGPISEAAGTVRFSLQRNTTITNSLTVNVTSNHSEFIQLPSSTVIFPANVDTVVFDARIVNDIIASRLIGSGPKDIEILATASGLPSTTLQVQIIDDDIATLTLQLSPTIREGDKGVATLSRNTPVDGELSVRLTSGDISILTVPTVITIPAGQRSVIFDVQAVADQLAFGGRTTSLSADATGLTSARLDVSVIEIDLPALTLEPIGSTDISEKDGSTTFRLRRNSPPTNSLVVGITSSLPNTVGFLNTVVIPQGALFVDFTVAAINDTLAGSDRNLTITAAAGTLSTTSSMTIQEDDSPVLIMALDSNSLAEGSSSFITVTLNRNTVMLPSLAVEIVGSLPGQIAVEPTQVSFLAGADNASFKILAYDDSLFEGTQSIQLTARATGIADAVSDLVTIADNETLSLTSDATIVSEKDGQTLFTVTRNITNTDQPLLVSLLSNNTTELTVPLLVTIPANAMSVSFFATSVDDALLDGLQSVQVLASANGYVAGNQSSLTINVSDHEYLSVQFDTDTIEESEGKVTATIARSNIDDPSQSLTVTLDNSADSRVHFPSNSIVIPAGEASVTIEGTAVDNKIYEGNQLVTITVSAAGFESGTASATVHEDEHAWHNYRNPLDVNNDGRVSPLDALLIINRLNSQLDRNLPPQLGVDKFIDVNLDDLVSPIDALMVINELNKPKSPEGEQATDNFFADYAADNWLDLVNSRLARHKANQVPCFICCDWSR